MGIKNQILCKLYIIWRHSRDVNLHTFAIDTMDIDSVKSIIRYYLNITIKRPVHASYRNQLTVKPYNFKRSNFAFNDYMSLFRDIRRWKYSLTHNV